jgi:hypothetical protein
MHPTRHPPTHTLYNICPPLGFFPKSQMAPLAFVLPPSRPPRHPRHPSPRLTRQKRCYTLEQASPAADPYWGDARPAGRM